MLEKDQKHELINDTRKHIEEIHKELKSSPKNTPREVPTETLKDISAALLEHFWKTERKIEYNKELEDFSTQATSLTLVAISIILLLIGCSKPGSMPWIEPYKFTIYLYGVFCSAIYVGISIEQTSFFKKLWSFGFTKLIFSIAISALIVFSTGKSSSIINSVFGVDASALPFTRAYISGILVFKYASPALIVVAFFSLVSATEIAGHLKSKASSPYTYSPPIKTNSLSNPINNSPLLLLEVDSSRFCRIRTPRKSLSAGPRSRLQLKAPLQ